MVGLMKAAKQSGSPRRESGPMAATAQPRRDAYPVSEEPRRDAYPVSEEPQCDAYPVSEEPRFQHSLSRSTVANTKGGEVSDDRRPLQTWWALLLCILVAVAAILCTVSDRAEASGGSWTSTPHKILVGPLTLQGGVAQLEHHAGSRVARLRVVTHTIWTNHTDLSSMLTIFKQSLARKQPFMIIWDARSLTFPRVRAEQVNQVREFVDEFAELFDTHVQAHIILLSNPVVRAFARVLLRFFEPPQPYIITKEDAAAEEFALHCCNPPRSYRKASYNKTGKFSF